MLTLRNYWSAHVATTYEMNLRVSFWFKQLLVHVTTQSLQLYRRVELRSSSRDGISLVAPQTFESNDDYDRV